MKKTKRTKKTQPQVKNPKVVRCRDCGMMYSALSRKSIERSIYNFNALMSNTGPLERKWYIKDVQFQMSLEDYEHCFKCGLSYKKFEKVKKLPSVYTLDFTIDNRD